MQFLKANTQVKVVIGPFVDVTDGFTPETGITLGTADEAELIKHDAASVTSISAATWAAITSCDGYYNLTLTTSHTDTEGMMTVVIQDDSVCLPVRAQFMVLAEAAYDSMFTAKDTGYMDVNVKAISEDETAANNCEAAFDTTGFGFTGCTMPTVTTLTGHTAQTADHAANITEVLARLGNEDVAAATGDPGTTVAAIAYLKQIVNILVGTAGVTTFPAEAAPANAVSLAEVIRAIHADVTGLNGDAMRGTDSAGTAAELAKVPKSDGTATWNSTALASINSEVSDVMKTDTISEMTQGIPPTTPTFEEAVMYLYMALTKKIDVDATLKEFYNNAGTVIWKKTLADDGTNYNEDKGASGP